VTERRPIVLAFARFYLPGYKAGGPIRTIANLVEALGDEIDFRIVTSDRDANDPAPYPDLPSDGSWTRVGKARALYLPPNQKRLLRIAEILRGTPYDTLYLNSFFDPVFTQRPLVARRLGMVPRRRCVIAPRGEFSRGALALKGLKKRVYRSAARLSGLYRDLTWQASSDAEAADIRRALGAVAEDIRIAVNLPETHLPAAVDLHRPRAPGEPLRVCFLSRISPMKNLDFALDVLARVRNPVQFDIYGALNEPWYGKVCQQRMAALPSHVKARYLGGVPRDKVMTTLPLYDLFFLPTRGENFGHAILEALLAGTPVLISDRTPWRGLPAEGIGWDVPLDDPSAFVTCIEHLFDADEATSLNRRARARAFARRQQNNPGTTADNRALFGDRVCRLAAPGRFHRGAE
jgi:glycosyltransferase involved in cell wall biosynthesis